MGIKGLNSLIKRYAPSGMKDLPIEDLIGSRIAIDCTILIYKFMHNSRVENAHIVGFINRVNLYLRYSIFPIFVFDGTPPSEKKLTLQKRSDNKQKLQAKIKNLENVLNDVKNEDDAMVVNQDISALKKQVINVTKNHINDCIELLRVLGIPYFVASG